MRDPETKIPESCEGCLIAGKCRISSFMYHEDCLCSLCVVKVICVSMCKPQLDFLLKNSNFGCGWGSGIKRWIK